VKLWERKLSRRKVLALGGATLASAYLVRGRAQPQPQLMRFGLVLPDPASLKAANEAAGLRFVTESATNGWTMAVDELGANAELLGQRLEGELVSAPDTEAALQEATRLIDEEEIFALAGGFGDEAALALSRLAAEKQVPFFNIGSASDALRGASCSPYSFHVEASAAMYIDALTDWYVRAEFRNWFYVYADDETGQARYARAQRSLTERHFGADEVGSAALPTGSSDYGELVTQIQEAEADFALLLVDAQTQLELLRAFDEAGLELQVTGFPEPATQTRAFLAASHEIAPRTGAGYRALLWEAKLDSYGARELNQRYLERFGTPMDGPAWSAYQTIKMAYEAAAFGGGTASENVTAYLENENTNFDVYKGIGVSYRPWDHQLRQSLYLVKINPTASTAFASADLVGELPAIYMPGTDPLERLDQLGDLEGVTQCSF
jgi:ABC-type branched-subunit amino acid transport system substrate-binding protein